MNEHDRLVDRAARDAHTVLFVGGPDRGQEHAGARRRAACALPLGRSVAGLHRRGPRAETVGPPGTRGHEAHRVRRTTSRTRTGWRDAGRAARSWGRSRREGHLLPLVTGSRPAARRGARRRAPTSSSSTRSGMVGGIYGQLGEYHKGGAAPARPRRRSAAAARSSPALGVIRAILQRRAWSRSGVHPGRRVRRAVGTACRASPAGDARNVPRRPQPVPDPAHGVHAEPPAALRAQHSWIACSSGSSDGKGAYPEWASSSTCRGRGPAADIACGRSAQGPQTGVRPSGGELPREARRPPEPVRNRVSRPRVRNAVPSLDQEAPQEDAEEEAHRSF